MDLGRYVGLPAQRPSKETDAQIATAAAAPADAAARDGSAGVAGLDADRLWSLYDHMLGQVEIPRVLQAVAQAASEGLHAERASVYLIDRQTHELESVAVVGNVAQTIRVPIEETSLAGYCALHERPLVVPDAYGDLRGIAPALRFDASWDRRNGFRTRDVLCAPARFRDRIVGVVQAINRRGRRPFGPEDLPALLHVSRLIAYALYHARLYHDLATLQRLEQEKAQFMRIMVHELKSPVAGARMLIEGLRAQGASDAAGVCDRIAGRLDHLLAMIRDLLELAKIKGGEPLGEVAVLDAAAAARQALQSYDELAAAKGLDLQAELPAEPLPVRFDSGGLQLVLSNLLSNAIKYTDTGRVRLGLGRSDEEAILEVTDTGIGIPAADVPKLFGEFFRAANARKRRIPGSGVGLAGVKRIVERFGGTLELDSRENEGTTITVRLPAHEA